MDKNMDIPKRTSAAVALLALLFQTSTAAAEAVEIPLPERKSGERVVLGAKIQPAKSSAEQKPKILVNLVIAPGHHIYGLKKSLSSSVPMKVEVKLPDGFKLADDWQAPQPEKIGGASVYRKEVLFRNRVSVPKNAAPGKHKAEIKVSFQVCNEALCWPPESLVTDVEFEVVKDAAKK
jgi:DsbC/DsbD-like thiol-disulfide interchange protein